MTSNSRLFADDTAVDRKIKSCDDQASLQADLDSLAEWETQWDMAFHPDKCQVLQVTNKKTKLEYTYQLHNQSLQTVHNTKYLGVTIQDNGKFDTHINNVVNAGNKMLGFARRNLKVNSKSAKEKAYKMLVRPKVEYAAAVWDPYTKEHINKLERIQRRAARVVSNDHHQSSSVTEMLKALDWPSLECRRQASRLTTLYKADKGTVMIKSAYLQPAPTRSRRTHNKQFTRLQSNKDVRMHSFFPRSIKEWNALPQETVSAPSADAFHKRILQFAC